MDAAELSFYLSDAELDFIVEAVHLVATHGVRLLPEYRFDPRSGLWRHRHPGDPGRAPTGNGHAHAAALPGQFERLRWFELPGACLTATRAG